MPKRLSIKAVIRKEKALADGRCTVSYRVSKNYKAHYKASDVAVLPELFDARASIDRPLWINRKHPLSAIYNEAIRNGILKLEAHRYDEKLTAQEIIDVAFGTTEKATLNSFWKEVVDGLYQSGNDARGDLFKGLLKKLDKFRPRIPFSAVDYDFIIKYKTYLLSHNKPSTTINTLRRMREVMKLAVKRKKIKSNPFDEMDKAEMSARRTTSTAKKGVLTPEELKKWAQVPLEQGSDLWHSRNIFLAQLFAGGARIGEMLQLRKSTVYDTHIEYAMEKKGDGAQKMKRVLITPPLRNILNMYSGGDSEYIFPFMDKAMGLSGRKHSNKKKNFSTGINEGLREIAVMAGIDKHFTTHTARHMGGQGMQHMGMALSEIQGSLGHDSPDVTKGYVLKGATVLVEKGALALAERFDLGHEWVTN